MRKIILLLGVFLLSFTFAMAQKTITGKVTSKEDGSALPGVTVAVKGTTTGTITDISGEYKLSVPATATTLVFSFVGMKSQEVEIGTQTTINVALESSATNLEGVVVTALGITREKKSLGYATQELKGDLVNTVKTDNFVNSLSGKISGVQVKKTTNIGGSTNIQIRGAKSLTGNNQALFVVDGVPISNDVSNTTSQQQAGQGFDYGNAASDINPDDIESINVLKGAAATALYGSRAANGVIMITTKKGSGSKVGKKGIGVTLNSGITVGFVDKTTFPTYQKNYGAGYGDYWTSADLNGDGIDEQWANTIDDASYGPKFDENLLVYQWDAVDPESPNYLKATPWVAAENGPVTFFNHPITFTNTVSIDNTTTVGSYRLSYTNYNQKGLMPNSELIKDNIYLSGSWKVTDKLTAAGSANYLTQKATGRNSTGYSDNICTSFRQWMETNVDMKDQWDAYDKTGRNVTWNCDPIDPVPAYWDNYYWTRYENYENDGRNRITGNMSLDYKVNDWFDIFGRVAGDSYNESQEERRAVGSIASEFGIGTTTDGSGGRNKQESGYLRRDITFTEYNYDVMLNFNKNISEDISFKGIIGNNIRRTEYNRIITATNGGLVVPGLYSLRNSHDPLSVRELATTIGVNGVYADASFGYKNYLYLETTLRRDHSSTLPVDKSKYYYPSISSNFVFSEFTKKLTWLSFGKVRLNYAQVGNGADFDQLTDNYAAVTPFYSPIYDVPSTKKNPELRPEMTKSIEGGLEMNFLGRRVGFDLAIYKTNTIDQILPMAISTATGYALEVVNAGNLQNSGIELTLNGTPVKQKNFKWDINVNWTKNHNKVLELMEGVDNLQLGSYQGGVTINAMVGEPYGVIYGTDYTYINGEKVLDPETGAPIATETSDNIIGNINPDWTGGISNTFTYKNWAFSFLVDIQKGGDIFSLDMYYGLATGLYPETDYTNDLGNPVRDPLDFNQYDADGNGIVSGGYTAASGGYIIDGVNPDGSINQTRIDAYNFGGFGYGSYPNKEFVYDASYVKLREVSLSYTLPSDKLSKCFITGATFSLIASNPWIIFKNLPYADPESGLGAGNLQGYTIGSLPSTRDFSFNVKLNF
ncbi:MAG TPA: SusC/RagA family TonB-linked outer membrane protein [Bacteroidales bacterium]|nr:SusC/RagA family TonB-linked outer membrane protein [Bacteroidales bacterium]HPS16657.1 SusC/RagA family TonB-linked outer membrane protein [Bacteroidales bacterium]